ncbi:MAG: hypothetical protein M1840_003697 [Geoglossum simile]|nr:MAG: hypothetical protein M1840_003697 [Geoglossum simile]
MARSSPAIIGGNKAAHHGDAVTDAGLYQSGRRLDESLLRAIYGVSSIWILLLSRAGDDGSISVLNARATLKANRDGPKKLRACGRSM